MPLIDKSKGKLKGNKSYMPIPISNLPALKHEVSMKDISASSEDVSRNSYLNQSSSSNRDSDDMQYGSLTSHDNEDDSYTENDEDDEDYLTYKHSKAKRQASLKKRKQLQRAATLRFPA